MNFLLLFLMLVATYLFQVGLVSVLVAEFKPFAIVSLAYLASLLAYGGIKMVNYVITVFSWLESAQRLLVVICSTCCTITASIVSQHGTTMSSLRCL